MDENIHWCKYSLDFEATNIFDYSFVKKKQSLCTVQCCKNLIGIVKPASAETEVSDCVQKHYRQTKQ